MIGDLVALGLTLAVLLVLGGVGVSGLRAGLRHRRAPEVSPATVWAREIEAEVRARGMWADGAIEVWTELGWWWISEPEIGTAMFAPSEARSELVDLYYRRASRAAREAECHRLSQSGRAGL